MEKVETLPRHQILVKNSSPPTLTEPCSLVSLSNVGLEDQMVLCSYLVLVACRQYYEAMWFLLITIVIFNCRSNYAHLLSIMLGCQKAPLKLTFIS